MKKFMNRMAKKEGFTLVELIVVIAILAILAGVAVPAYSAYISKAQESADISALESIEVAAQAAMAGNGDSVTGIKVEATNGTISKVIVNGTVVLYGTAGTGETAAAATVQKDFTDFAGTLPTLKVYTSGATWTSNKWDDNTSPN